MFLTDYTKQNTSYSALVRELMTLIKKEQDDNMLDYHEDKFKEAVYDWEAFKREYGFLTGHNRI